MAKVYGFDVSSICDGEFNIDNIFLHPQGRLINHGLIEWVELLISACKAFRSTGWAMIEDNFLSEEAPASATLQSTTSPSRRILLVDDDVYIRELNAAILIQSGYQVDTANDGADAWKALQNHTYDLLITDNRMPRVTGLELIKKLRSEDIMLPVILASGTVPIEELNRHPWLQLDATLLKPFTITELLETVHNVMGSLDRARLRVELDYPVIMAGISQVQPPPLSSSRPL